MTTVEQSAELVDAGRRRVVPWVVFLVAVLLAAGGLALVALTPGVNVLTAEDSGSPLLLFVLGFGGIGALIALGSLARWATSCWPRRSASARARAAPEPSDVDEGRAVTCARLRPASASP